MIKKFFKGFFMVIGVLVVIFIAYTTISYGVSVHNYNERINASTVKVKPQNISKLVKNKKEVFVYFGRSSCPYCREFSKKLNPAVKKTKAKVYYVQTRTDNKSKALNRVRKTYNIKFVPTLLKVSNGNVTKYNDKDNLVSFLKQ